MVKSFILSNCSFERFTVTVFLCHRCNIVIYLSIYIYAYYGNIFGRNIFLKTCLVHKTGLLQPTQLQKVTKLQRV